VIEGGSHSVIQESNQRHLMKDRSWLSWEWSAQKQGGGGSRLAIHVVSSRFVRNSHERPN